MTTPLCNEGCEESVGWLPETSWPYSASSKTSAQSIYCLSGSPVVPPRAVFKSSWGDARQDSAGTGRALGSGGAIGSGAFTSIPTSLTVSNTNAYPIDVFGIWSGNADLNILGTAVYRFQTQALKDNVVVATATTYEYGNGAVTNGWRYMKNEAWISLGTLAPNTSAVFTVKTSWNLTAGAASSSVMNSFSSALRVITGTT